jgi:uncharacterized membrane protein
MGNKQRNLNMARIGIVAALYVAMTMLLSPMAYGAMQIRFSELFNHFAAFNKRYIVALTLGCMIANFTSPLGIIDIIFGAAGTLLGTSLTWLFARKVSKKWAKLAIATLCQLPAMVIVAVELSIFYHMPFWGTYLACAGGEMISMVIGAVIVYAISTRVDLAK